jgi:pimeloyl-ACP methyl ester carboxylesterase
VKAINLVLLPGMDGTGILFEPLLSVLPSTVQPTVVRYPADEPLDHAALLPRVLAALPGRGEMVLLGESFSGPLALMAAATAPPGLRATILCASFVQSPLRAPRLLRPFASPGLLGAVPLGAQVLAMLGSHVTPHLRDLLALALAKVTPAVLAARARAILDVDATAELRACAGPLLYLRAMQDRMVPERCAKLITAQKPDARIIALPGPHLLLQARPKEAWEAIESFLREEHVECGNQVGPVVEHGKLIQ